MSKKTIKPAQPGLVVRHPENGRKLAATGEEVEWSAFWQRRLNDGDVVEATKVVQKKPAPVQADKGGSK